MINKLRVSLIFLALCLSALGLVLSRRWDEESGPAADSVQPLES